MTYDPYDRPPPGPAYSPLGRPLDPALPPPQDPWAETYLGPATVPTEPAHRSPAATRPILTAPVRPKPHLPPRQELGRLIMIFLTVLVVGCAGSIGIWWGTTGRKGRTAGNLAPTQAGPAASCPNGRFDPCAVQQGQCLVNLGTAAQPDMTPASSCEATGAYLVIKVSRGEDVPEGPDGKLADASAAAVCADTGYEYFYGYNSDNDHNDVIFCLVAAGPGSAAAGSAPASP